MSLSLGRLTYPEVKAHLERGAIALWPIGSTEAHGPHLPLDTDVVIAQEVCRRAEPRLKKETGLQALCLPQLAFTLTDCALPFAGTISLPAQTVTQYVRDVIVGAFAQGFRLVCLVNAHLEPQHRATLRSAVQEAQQLGASTVLADPAERRWVHRLSSEFQQGACHAGQYETSLMMASDPAAVREDIRRALDAHQVDILAQLRAGARNFADMGADNCYVGAPRAATAAEGDDTYNTLADIVCEVAKEALH